MTDHQISSILRTLHEEHMATIAMLERLEALLRRQGAASPPASGDKEAAALLGDLVVMLEDEITHHYAFEEKYLFPKFSEHYDPGIPMMLQGEHETIRPLAESAAGLARTAGTGGFTPEAWKEFHELAAEIVEREVFHVQKEEMGFLPALNQVMDPDLEKELSLAYSELKGG